MIRVNEDYVIEVNQYEYKPMHDMHKTAKDKNGNETPVYKTIGHCSTLEYAVKLIFEYNMKMKFAVDDVSLNECVEILKETRAKINDTIDKLKIEQ